MTNWAGNVQFGPARVHAPSTVEEMQEIVAGATSVKAIGSRHSFNRIADTDGDLVSTEALNEVHGMYIDGIVEVGSGTRYGDLATYLDKRGRALANMASLPHISIGGSCATGTHGSGMRNPGLASAVTSMDVVTPSGDLRRIRRGIDPEFDAVVVGVGALGIVVRLSLETLPAFEMRQTVHPDLAWSVVQQDFDGVMGCAYSVSLFTDWTGDAVSQVWVKRLADQPLPPIVGPASSIALHPLPGGPAEACSQQLDMPGPAHERLPHFRMGFTPSQGAEIQTEYLLPIDRAAEAIGAMREMGDLIAPNLWVSEIRTVAAETAWLSPAHAQDSVAIHFTWRPLPERVAELVPQIEARLGPLGARPHWGKVFAMPASEVQPRYPRFSDFRDLASRLDPTGKFRNEWLNRHLFG